MSRVQDLFDLSGRVAVLTGVGSGIGKATAKMLSSAGATIVGGDIDEDGAQSTADEIKGEGGTAAVRRVDVTKRAEVDGLVDFAASEHGRVDIMGNIAGVPHNKLVAECTDEEFERILAINLKSVFYGCQAAIRHMVPQGSGNIVNIASGAIDIVQIDACRLGGLNEVLAVLLMAAKFGLPVWPHAGGVGLCEYVQHLAMIDYLVVSRTKQGRMVEYVDHLHEHFVDPCVVRHAAYMPPQRPGFSIEMKAESIASHTYR